MRIGIVVPGGVDPSGRERVIPAVLWLVERVARRHETHVFVLYQSATPLEYTLFGARIHDLGLFGKTSVVPGAALLRARRALEQAVRAFGPFDLLHAFWASAPGFLATSVARHLSIPAVVSLGGDELVSLPQIGYGAQLKLRGRLLVRASLKAATRVTAASGPMCRAGEALGLSVERIPLGADISLFSGGPAPDGPPWRLLQVAHLNPVKDQETLLAAFARVAIEIPDISLDIVGQDTRGGRIQALAASLGIADRLRFPGLLPIEEVAGLYRRAHLLLVSSRHEAGPLVVLEAAAASVPTVGTAVGHVADLSGAGAAVAVPVGDSAALARAIVRVLTRPDERRAMAERARSFSLENDADATVRRFEAVYENAVRLG